MMCSKNVYRIFFCLFFDFFNLFKFALSGAPAGCALDDTASLIGRFDCEFNSVSFPLVMTDFSSPDPQRIRIYNVSGTLSSPSFSGFSSFNTGTIDTDYPTLLEIECVNGGTLDISAGTFTGMDYIQEFYITNCVIPDLPDNVFTDFGTLNYFKIEGGSIGVTQTNSLNGLNVARSSSPTPLGAFIIYNSPIITGELASGFLNPLTTVTTIMLKNTGLDSIEANMFSQNTLVRNLSIAGNNFQVLPTNIFSGLDALMFLDMSDVPFNCSCSNAWFLDYLVEHDISIVGAAVCSEPSSYNLQRATIFQDENCPYDPCGNIPGINADPRCHTIFQVFGYVVTCGCLLMTLMAIYLYLNTRLHIAMPKFRLEQKKKNAWIKVQDSLYKGVVNMIPPASTGVNGVKLPPIKRAMRKRFSSPNVIQHSDLPNNSDLEKNDLEKEINEKDNIAPFGNSYSTNEMSNKSKTDSEV
ncbi:uncharacterized protein LOC134693795 [Mytilus trossulus]|uniref:uncharacterized protein LOC134693795 n=1 Tax=Mytilus trossulus TaxID=6551 RepID=UPI0030050E40